MESSSESWTSSSEFPLRHFLTKKSRSPIYKRHKNSTFIPSRYIKPEVADLARRFNLFYPKYKALHDELSSMGENRDKQKEENLLEIHARLASMKKEIEKELDRFNDSGIESGIDQLSQRDFNNRENHSRHPGERIGSSLDLTDLQHGVLYVKPELKLEDEDESSHFGSGEYVKYASPFNDSAYGSRASSKSVPSGSHPVFQKRRAERPAVPNSFENAQTPMTGEPLTAQKYDQDNMPLDSPSRIKTPVDSNPSESPREEFLERIFEQNGIFISHSPATSTDSQGSSNSSQPTTTTVSSSSATESSQSAAAPGKRKLSNDDEESNRENRSRKHGRPSLSNNSEQDALRGRRLACHFHLFDKQKYCKNNRTGKKFETCSGPGWPSIHHLKQHLGNSASSIHKRIRCPRCSKGFKTASAVLKHQDAYPLECMPTFEQPAVSDQDDIDKYTWGKIEDEISRRGFGRLLQSEQYDVDHWVLKNLEDNTPIQAVEERKWELRKWNMMWRILFPSYETPPSPFYNDESVMSLTNTELLIKSFKETVESRIELGDIEGVDDETLDKLMESLQVAISIASSSNQQQRDHLRQKLLHATLPPEPKHEEPDMSHVASLPIISDKASPKETTLAEDTMFSGEKQPDSSAGFFTSQIPRTYEHLHSTTTIAMSQNGDLCEDSHGIHDQTFDEDNLFQPVHLPNNTSQGALFGDGQEFLEFFDREASDQPNSEDGDIQLF